jgi:molybdenum cofactor cytidylyltransferase
MTNISVGVIILAAGASTRMGTPKQLLHYQGRSLLRHTTEIALASKSPSIVVVLGSYAEKIQSEISNLPVQVVLNQQWATGMCTSIRAGIEALNQINQNLEAAIIALCDQPFISTDIINSYIDLYYSSHPKIIASQYADTLGVPALFNSTLFPELSHLQATEGAKQVIKKNIKEVISIPFPQGIIDIDTPKDYQQLLKISY